MKKHIKNKELQLLLSDRQNSSKESIVKAFHSGFRNAIREVKLAINGKTELKDADNWIKEI